MTRFVVLLRAVNVGGTGKLPMADLKAMCEELGFGDVRTYIASGNVVLASDKSEKGVKAALERRLADHAGKPVGVLVRTAAEMEAVLAANPFAGRPANYTVAIFLDAAPPGDALETVRNRTTEEMAVGTREFYVHYPDGQGRSKLAIPAARDGTARNMNTVAKLVEMATAQR